MEAIYLTDEECEKARALLDDYSELLQKICSRLALESHARCSTAVLEARNQTAAVNAGLGKAFETVVTAISAEIDEQQNQIEAEIARLKQEADEEEGNNAS
jgi:hypothetical protein